MEKLIDLLNDCSIEWFRASIKERQKEMDTTHEIELMVKKSDGYNESNEFFAGESTAKVLSMIENDFFNDIQGMIASVDKVYKNLEKLGLDKENKKTSSQLANCN
jgi:hypothetical protein